MYYIVGYIEDGEDVTEKITIINPLKEELKKLFIVLGLIIFLLIIIAYKVGKNGNKNNS